MGLRLHSAVKYDVKYEGGFFNWSTEYINPIIVCLAENDFWCDDEDCVEYAHIIEADRDNLLKNIDKIINPDDLWEYQDELNELLDYMEKESENDREYLYKNLKEMIVNSASNVSCVHFSWY